jgi:hypothetical protein
VQTAARNLDLPQDSRFRECAKRSSKLLAAMKPQL